MVRDQTIYKGFTEYLNRIAPNEKDKLESERLEKSGKKSKKVH